MAMLTKIKHLCYAVLRPYLNVDLIKLNLDLSYKIIPVQELHKIQKNTQNTYTEMQLYKLLYLLNMNQFLKH